KFLLIVALFLLFSAGVFLYPMFAGLLLIFSLLIFGSLCMLWKEPYIKIGGLVLLVILAVANIGFNGMKFGIDFSGGTRIPILLEHEVDENTMNELVQTIKKRVSVLGLTEAKVRAIGDTEINVEIPSTDEKTIQNIEDTLSHQGVYLGVVDGRIAVSGEDIFSSSIAPQHPAALAQSGADWGVTFSVDRTGAERFAEVAEGKADYPVHMYLDRPSDAALFYTRAQLRDYILLDSNERESMHALEDALSLEDVGDISVYILDDLENITPATNDTVALISEDASEEYKAMLRDAGFELREFTEEEIAANFTRTNSGVLMVNMLEAVGLLNSPLLSSGLTTGVPVYNFAITGSAMGADQQARAEDATIRTKSIISILKGGSLPVQISLGSRTSLPPSLGAEFLRLSLVAIVAALITISLLIGLRYRNVMATLPIIAISIAELIILLSILGSFTIDLAAMAGIIAAIGVGVDAQIVITDELLKKDSHSRQDKMDHAFSIIKTNVTVATLSMIPLLFSGLVEVIGFAISTIIGSLLGYLLTRPAYAAIVGRIVGKEE
ncbi:TPA: hypothetical protein EYP38_00860, partial [Candidatus Micrarchaeota archaeon]|nr:hypothetical protein [Candidatus Micrarchaeota archaeon]